MSGKKPSTQSGVDKPPSEAATASSPESKGSPYAAHHVHEADRLVHDEIAAAGTPDARLLKPSDIGTPELVNMVTALQREGGVGAPGGSAAAGVTPAAAVRSDTPTVVAATGVKQNDIRANDSHVKDLFDNGPGLVTGGGAGGGTGGGRGR